MSDDRPYYGLHGCFLASLSALSILAIHSKHFKHHSQNAITMFRGEVIRRQFPITRDFHGLITSTSGTNVAVMNLFGDMPVRVKQRANDTAASLKEWDDLKKQVAALLLCCPNTVTVELRDTEYLPPRKAKISAGKDQQLSPSKSAQPRIKICSLLYQAGFISSPHTSSWANVAGSTSKLQLHGAICLEPCPTKNTQFISIGISPVMNEEGHNVLYEAINKVFANSLFGVVDDLPELDEREKKRRAEDRRFKTDGYTNKELKGTGKGVDRWPMFALRIEINDLPQIRRLHSTDDIFEDDNALASITNLLQQVAVGFLMENKLMPKNVPKQKSPKKRDRYGDLIQRDDYRVQPRHVSSDTPRKKLQSAPASTIQSPKGPSRTASPKNAATFAPITRTASPFDIWSRVKSGRTMNAPAVPKPTSPTQRSNTPSSPTRPGTPMNSARVLDAPSNSKPKTVANQTATPMSVTRPSTPMEGARRTCPTLPPRPLFTSAISQRSASTSSHFSKPESIISKKGTVLALPFQDVSHTSAQRRDSAVSWTRPKPMMNPGPNEETQEPSKQKSKELSVLEDSLRGNTDCEKSSSNSQQGILAPSTPGGAQPEPAVIEEKEWNGTRFTPVKNRNRSPENDRGRRREPWDANKRADSWTRGYRDELETFLEEHQRRPRGSLRRTPVAASAPQRHTAPPEVASARKHLSQSRARKPLPSEPFKTAKSAIDNVILYKDVNGKETLINTRTGQTVANQAATSAGLPTRPSPRKDRLSRRLPGSISKREEEERKASSFVMSVLKDFHNPAFKPILEPSIPQISNSSTTDSDAQAILHGHKHNCSHIDIDKAFNSSRGARGEIGRLSKEGLRKAEVVNQVDNKFILIRIREATGEVLVLVDQHAADERIRIESLLSSYFDPARPPLQFSGKGYPASALEPGVRVDMLEKPISFEVDLNEGQKLRMRQQYFAQWGVCFGIGRSKIPGKLMFTITALASGIAERCKLEPKLIINLIRKEVYASVDKLDVPTAGADGDWLERIHNIPQGILDMLNSRACRSAIMFNDALSLQECKTLIDKLAKTRFPFICAHGRPSMVPLVETSGLGGYEDEKAMNMADWMAEMRREGW